MSTELGRLCMSGLPRYGIASSNWLLYSQFSIICAPSEHSHDPKWGDIDRHEATVLERHSRSMIAVNHSLALLAILECFIVGRWS